MWSFAAFCDEFYVNTRLFVKLDLNPARDSLLHFFEQIRKAFPTMTRLRRRDDGAYMLDEDANDRGRRFVRVDTHAVKFGNFSPPDSDTVGALAETVLTQAPYALSLSDLDYDYMEVAYSFDLEYRGNHDELVCDTLFADHPFMRALMGDGRGVIDCQPFFGVATAPDCEQQVYLELKGRTSTFEVRTGEYEASPLSVCLTTRRYWGFPTDKDLIRTHRDLVETGEQIATDRVVPHIVQPLAAAIASQR